MRWAGRVVIGMFVALSVLGWAPRFSEADATVTAIGRFVFQKDGVGEVGIRRARVEMCDEDGLFGGCATMAVGETTDDGHFSLTGTAGDIFGGLPDVVVKVMAQSEAGTVEWAGFTGGVFCFKAGPWNEAPHGATLDFGTLSPFNGVHCSSGGDVDQENGAWELHNLVVEAHQFMRHFTLATPGRDMPSVKVRWPADRTAYERPDIFSSPNGQIWVANLAGAEKFFMKQYGHHVLQHFADYPTPNFNNGSCDSQTDLGGVETGRCRWRSENGAIAWTEGFPIFLSEVLNRFWGHPGFGGVHIGPGPHPHLDEAFHLVPEVTATILWNLVGWATAGDTVGMDADGDNHDLNHSVDRVSVGFETIWDVLVNFDPSGDATYNHARSIQDFWSGMAAHYPDLANRVSAVYHESHVVMPAANLKVNMVSASPAVVNRGGTLTVSDATVNAGAVRTGEQSTTQLFLSTDNVGTAKFAIGQRTVPSLLPSQDSGASTNITIPSSVPYGAYYVIACADGPAVIFESNETDNCRASGTTVQVAEAGVAPGAPTGLGQLNANGTAWVPLGAWLNQNTVVLRFTMTDANGSDRLTPEVEVKAVGAAFTGSGLRAGASVPSNGGPVQGSVTVTGLAIQKYHWRARVKDAAGHVSGWVSFGGNGETSGDFGIDTGAPTGSVKIDNGAKWSTDPTVSLKLLCADGKGSGCASMQFSNDNHSFTAPEPFAANRSWTLAPGNGQKTVYVRYIDGVGNVSKSYQDTITLDTAGPAVGAVIPTPSTFRPALGETTTIRFAVSDQLSGSCSLKIRILGAAGFVAKTINKTAACSPSGTTTSVIWDGKAGGAPVPAGTYSIEVTATDQAGNVGAVSNGTVVVQ